MTEAGDEPLFCVFCGREIGDLPVCPCPMPGDDAYYKTQGSFCELCGYGCGSELCEPCREEMGW